MIRRLLLALGLVALPVVLAALAWPAPAGAQRSELPVPRYVSLRADEVRLRAGPNVSYPIEWVLRRRHLPVEIIAEFELWRRVRDPQGAEGWVHQSLLSGRRYLIITGDTRTLRRRPEPEAPPVARVEAGVVGELIECQGAWCRLDAGGFRGWLRRSEVWGVYPDEVIH
jgi:SH3-like domain-containing protein